MSPLYKDKLEKLLREIPELSPQEREYVKALFSKVESGGIEKWEAEKLLKGMKLNFKDNLDRIEVEKVKQKILSAFNS